MATAGQAIVKSAFPDANVKINLNNDSSKGMAFIFYTRCPCFRVVADGSTLSYVQLGCYQYNPSSGTWSLVKSGRGMGSATGSINLTTSSSQLKTDTTESLIAFIINASSSSGQPFSKGTSITLCSPGSSVVTEETYNSLYKNKKVQHLGITGAVTLNFSDGIYITNPSTSFYSNATSAQLESYYQQFKSKPLASYLLNTNMRNQVVTAAEANAHPWAFVPFVDH